VTIFGTMVTKGNTMDNVFIRNEKELIEKIDLIKNDGKDNLHIVSDFDNTLSKAYVNGEKAQSIIGQLRRLGYLGEEYQKQYDALYNKYNPIEINPNISMEEKDKAMTEWWSTHIKVLSSFGLCKDILDKVIENSTHLILRENIKYFFDILNKNNIPLLIFSASPKYFIDGYLQKYNFVYPNMSIIANHYDFDSEGKVLGYKNKIIHVFNKGEVAIKDNPHFDSIKKRKNVILLGDSIGDLNMPKGIEHKTIITIGFYNNPDLKGLDEYKTKYDVVLLNDTSMDFVNDLLNKIL
jgi:5'-nucleotidase